MSVQVTKAAEDDLFFLRDLLKEGEFPNALADAFQKRERMEKDVPSLVTLYCGSRATSRNLSIFVATIGFPATLLLVFGLPAGSPLLVTALSPLLLLWLSLWIYSRRRNIPDDVRGDMERAANFGRGLTLLFAALEISLEERSKLTKDDVEKRAKTKMEHLALWVYDYSRKVANPDFVYPDIKMSSKYLDEMVTQLNLQVTNLRWALTKISINDYSFWKEALTLAPERAKQQSEERMRALTYSSHSFVTFPSELKQRSKIDRCFPFFKALSTRYMEILHRSSGALLTTATLRVYFCQRLLSEFWRRWRVLRTDPH